MKPLLTKKMRFITLFIFIGLTIIFAGLSPLVKVNYDLKEYLPKSSDTIKSFEVMKEEFGDTSMIQMMTTNLSIEEASYYVDTIKNFNSVKSIMWLGTIVDLTIPLDSIDPVIKKGFYNEGNLLFVIEFSEDDYSLEVGKCLGKIQNLMRENNIETHFRGSAINNQSSRDKVSSEMIWIFVLAVPIAIIILFLSSHSWMEPVVILINLSVAIVINLGTNFLLDSVSYITIAIASVLQLAMSLDYSLFIIHRYYEEREKNQTVIDSAVISTKAAFNSVTASALTTVFGFLSLIFMRYKIGLDIGISLAKAIIISYVVTIIFLPVLLVIFDKSLLKYKHKTINLKLEKISNLFIKGKIPIVFSIIVIGALGFFIQTKTNYAYGDAVVKDKTDRIYIDEVAISNEFGPFQPIVILYKESDKSEAIYFSQKLREIPEVTQIQSLVTSVDPSIPESIIPVDALSQFRGKSYYRMIIYVNIIEENERMYSISSEIKDLANSILPSSSYVLGVPVSVSEIKKTVSADGIVVQLISALVIALTIGLIMKSTIIPIILVLLIEISIWLNIAVTAISGGTIAYIGYLVVTSLQLGATIDYAVLLTGRYQEFRESNDAKDSIALALEKSVPAIVTSSLVLSAAGFVVFIISKVGMVKEIGMLIGRGTLMSGILVILILPALLLTFDKLIQKTLIKGKSKKGGSVI